MQDPSKYQHQINHLPQFPDHQQEHLKCPRCDSDNTKFCYYNNYNLSQPRHLCKNCKRYWTKGGALRNIPIGGQSRKNMIKKTSNNPKRHSVSNSSSVFTNSVSHSSSVFQNPVSDSGLKPEHGLAYGAPIDHVNGSFSSLLASGGQFGNWLGGAGTVQMGEFSSSHGLNLDMELQNGWPDLTI